MHTRKSRSDRHRVVDSKWRWKRKAEEWNGKRRGVDRKEAVWCCSFQSQMSREGCGGISKSEPAAPLGIWGRNGTAAQLEARSLYFGATLIVCTAAKTLPWRWAIIPVSSKEVWLAGGDGWSRRQEAQIALRWTPGEALARNADGDPSFPKTARGGLEVSFSLCGWAWGGGSGAHSDDRWPDTELLHGDWWRALGQRRCTSIAGLGSLVCVSSVPLTRTDGSHCFC